MAGSGRWHYIAQRYSGDEGALGEFLDFNVPLEGVNISDVLSGHNGLSGSISPEYMRLKAADGRPILEEWKCAIWAEDPDGEIRGGGILTHSEFEGPNWNLECTDLTGTSIETPYTDANYWIGVDPMDLFRYIWWWMQTQPGGNVGIDVDGVKSPIRLGDTMIQRVEFDLEPDPSDPTPVPVPTQPSPYATNEDWITAGVKAMKAVGWTGSVVRDVLQLWFKQPLLGDRIAFPEGRPLTQRENMIKDKVIQKIGWPPDPPYGESPPITYVIPPEEEGGEPPVVWEYDAYKLAWYKDHDLSKTIDDLATLTPFDWYLEHHWSDETDDAVIRHQIRLGYPRIGRRLTDRFVIGENVRMLPRITREGGDYANEILFLGAGEGSAQITARAFRRSDGAIRRVAVVSDPSVTDQRLANMRAESELARRIILDDLAEIVLEDHPNAPMGSVGLGDEILLEGETGWIDLEVWVRVVGRTISPETGEAMTLSVIRSDRLL